MMLPHPRKQSHILLLVVACRNATAFLQIHSTTRQQHHLSLTVSFAEAKSNRKSKKIRKTTTVGGGFGKISASKSTTSSTSVKDEDYSVFPALEPNVSETLLEAPGSWQVEAGSLPLEVYDRLAQIYGFPNFNYETRPGEQLQQEADFSFQDLLTVSPSSSRSSLSTNQRKSSLFDADFADLLTEATTDGEMQSMKSSLPVPVKSNKNNAGTSIRNDICKLPPFEEFRVLHLDPLVLAIDDFFTMEECDRYVDMSLTASATNSSDHDNNNTLSQIETFQTRSKTVGKDKAAKSQRTSTTWFHHYKNVPELMAKATRLVGLDTLTQWEEPQTVRYRPKEKFTWHLDALAHPQATEVQGGQRVATLLVYLKDLEAGGGATVFRDLKGLDGGPLKVQPRKGAALMFFPAAGGIPNTPFDIRTLHCGESVAASSSTEKWISQLWLRESRYTPTAPAGTTHAAATDAVQSYCERMATSVLKNDRPERY